MGCEHTTFWFEIYTLINCVKFWLAFEIILSGFIDFYLNVLIFFSFLRTTREDEIIQTHDYLVKDIFQVSLSNANVGESF